MEVPQEIQSEIINLMMDPRLQRFVTEVLYHQDPALRSRILWILGESGSQNALSILETKLRDPDYSVRETIQNSRHETLSERRRNRIADEFSQRYRQQHCSSNH
jgi:HEAT repeat protein